MLINVTGGYNGEYAKLMGKENAIKKEMMSLWIAMQLGHCHHSLVEMS